MVWRWRALPGGSAHRRPDLTFQQRGEHDRHEVDVKQRDDAAQLLEEDRGDAVLGLGEGKALLDVRLVLVDLEDLSLRALRSALEVGHQREDAVRAGFGAQGSGVARDVAPRAEQILTAVRRHEEGPQGGRESVAWTAPRGIGTRIRGPS